MLTIGGPSVRDAPGKGYGRVHRPKKVKNPTHTFVDRSGNYAAKRASDGMWKIAKIRMKLKELEQ